MTPSARTAPLHYLLLLLAVCGQLLLPVAQGQVMAQNGQGLAGLVCGAGSPGFAASLRDQLPPELLAAIDEGSESGGLMACAACCAASGDSAPGLVTAGAVQMVAASAPAQLGAARPARSAPAYPPPARAPPQA